MKVIVLNLIICFLKKKIFGDILTTSVDYVYDNHGRIVSIVRDRKNILYKYYIYGRLIREDNRFIKKTIKNI